MAGSKQYGVDGPPQLIGRSRRVSADELLDWFRQTQEPTWAHWSDAERKRRLDRLLSQLGEWFRKVVCHCGRDDHFRASVTDPFRDLFSRRGISVGVVHLELTCGACGSALTVFDSGTSGWNAVISGERKELPPDYAARVQASLQPVTCLCGSTSFGCLVSFCYDSHPDDLPTSDEDWDEAFGAFAAWTICGRCGVAQQVAEAETA